MNTEIPLTVMSTVDTNELLELYQSVGWDAYTRNIDALPLVALAV